MSFIILTGCAQTKLSQTGSAQPANSDKIVHSSFHTQSEAWQQADYQTKPFTSLIQHSFCQEGGDFDPDISADSKWLVLSSSRNTTYPDLYLKQVNGATATRLTSDSASEIQPAFSPATDKVAYASNRSGSWDIWVVGIDGTNPTRLTNDTTDNIHPSWSPDGTQIVYCSFGGRSRQWELWVLDVANPGIKKFIGYGLFPRWSPNAQVPKIVFQLARNRGSQWFSIWTIDMVDGEARYPTEIISSSDYACICPAWSPDASKITYGTIRQDQLMNPLDASANAVRTTTEDIWIVDIDGRNNQRLTNGDARNFSPVYAPNGRIFFCSDRNNVNNIWSIIPRTVEFNPSVTVDLTSHPQSGILAN